MSAMMALRERACTVAVREMTKKKGRKGRKGGATGLGMLLAWLLGPPRCLWLAGGPCKVSPTALSEIKISWRRIFCLSCVHQDLVHHSIPAGYMLGASYISLLARA